MYVELIHRKRIRRVGRIESIGRIERIRRMERIERESGEYVSRRVYMNQRSKVYVFNGWGMDRNVLTPFMSEGTHEIIHVGFPYDVAVEDIQPDDVLVGWSFGVYYLNRLLHDHPELRYAQAIAINGLPLTMGKYGIHSRMMQMTLDTLTEENLEKFYDNMDIDESFHRSDKSLALIHHELAYFMDHYEALDNHMDYYYIGQGDRIIPANKVRKYCEELHIPYEIIDCGHYPFSYFTSIESIVNHQ